GAVGGGVCFCVGRAPGGDARAGGGAEGPPPRARGGGAGRRAPLSPRHIDAEQALDDGLTDHRRGASVRLVLAGPTKPRALPFAHRAGMRGPVAGNLEQVLTPEAPVAAPELGRGLATAPPVPDGAVLVHPLIHLHLVPGGVRRIQRQAGFGGARLDPRALEGGPDARHLVWLGQAVVDGGGIANGDDVLFGNVVF